MIWETVHRWGRDIGGLRERTAELAAIDAWIDAAQAGQGSLMIVDGSPGIGKTSLIEAARRRTAAAGFRVLRARGGQLEQDFAFGLVRQLFEPLMASASEAERRRGSREPRRWPLRSSIRCSRLPAPPWRRTYRLFHALYWLLANLADDSPLALIVDDAHWGDAPSIRFLEFLAARIDDLPIAAIIASRPERPELDAMQLDDRTRVLRPGPFSDSAVAAALADALDRLPADGVRRRLSARDRRQSVPGSRARA